MTGIERLHKLIADIDASADPELWYILRGGTEGGWDCEEHDGKTLDSTLAAIADQIKREQGGRVSRMRVLSVVTEMERHVSGAEGMEDSPVARWARELREALGGDGRDRAADASVSAYGLLSAGERKAIAWVREHGGLGAVERRWECLSYYADPVPRSCMEKRLARLQRQIDECHEALRRRNQRIEELTHRVSDLTTENVELRKRAMPEGYEWPRYESGEPLRYDDRYVYDGREREVWHVDFDSYGEPTILNKDGTRCKPDKGERVERPAPKVLDADGVEVELGDDLYSVEGMLRFHVSAIDKKSGRIATEAMFALDKWADPKMYTHRAPVLAADGEPLEVGQTVWFKTSGSEMRVDKIEHRPEGFWALELFADGSKRDSAPVSVLTHQRPVLDADGVPIKKGDTVYWLEHTGAFTVVSPHETHDNAGHELKCGHTVEIAREGHEPHMYVHPESLGHTKPEPPDSWERIEEDATLGVNSYRERYGIGKHDGMTWSQLVREDLVRRCRALAERERGE